MIPVQTLVILPAAPGSASDQARSALDLLAQRLQQDGLEWRQALSLTFFVDVAGAESFPRLRDDLTALVRDVFSPEAPPPVSIVAESPESGLVALEACLPLGPAADLTVVHKTHEGVAYTVLQRRDLRQLHAGGLSSPEGLEDPEAQAQEVFSRMGAVLAHEGLDYGNVVRQWNYIESMLEDCPVGRRDRQRYQVFNDVRTVAYGSSAFPHGYPAATGIAQSAGGVVLEFIALAASSDVAVEALSNPRQVDAHCYSGEVLVGRPAQQLKERTAPKFERAKRVAGPWGEAIFVSGTAAILGEESVAPGDVIAQTQTTIQLMSAFLDGDAPSYMRAYVKRVGDIPLVREVCEAAYGRMPATFVQADVCRGELLVEMEAMLFRPAAASDGGVATVVPAAP